MNQMVYTHVYSVYSRLRFYWQSTLQYVNDFEIC